MIYLRHKGFRQEACFIKAPASAERVFFLFSYLEFACSPLKSTTVLIFTFLEVHLSP